MLEVGRTYKDKGGRDVRIICTDAALVKHGNPTPVIGLIKGEREDHIGYYGPAGGRTDLTHSEFDLILPRRFIDLEEAVGVIRGTSFIDEMEKRLRALPTQEIFPDA